MGSTSARNVAFSAAQKRLGRPSRDKHGIVIATKDAPAAIEGVNPRQERPNMMRRTGAASAAFGLVLVASVAMAAPSKDVEAIKALEAKFTDAFNAKDVDAIMKSYVADDSLFVFDVIPPRQYVGVAAYRKDWTDFLATFLGQPKLVLSDLAVETQGGIGYGHNIQHIEGTDTKGQPLSFTVRVSDVYRKVKGKWAIVQEHVSVPVDFDTGKPDLLSKP
jgi:ketosteroid isomerase-like protein